MNRIALNLYTFSVCGFVISTIVAGWGLWLQNLRIWGESEKKGKSVPVNMNSYFLFLMFVQMSYALSVHDFLLDFNALVRLVLYIAICLGLCKVKGLTKSEKIFLLVMYAISTVICLAPHKDWSFLILCLGGLAMTVEMPYQIWKQKSRGVVDLWFLLTAIFNTLFWVSYGFITNNWVLKANCPLFLALYILTMILWFRYK